MSIQSLSGRLSSLVRRRHDLTSLGLTPPAPESPQPEAVEELEQPEELDQSEELDESEEVYESEAEESESEVYEEVAVEEASDEESEAEPSAPAVSDPIVRKEVEKPLRILVAECDPAEKMMAWLEEQGYSISVAEDGQSTLEALDREVFDVVLIDIQLPVKNGYEVTRTVRQRERKRAGTRVPMIGMVANAMRGDREICLEAGFDDYLPKPVRIHALESMLKALPANPVRRAECA
jgi:CheY-like chemotaxis protein